MQARVNLLKLTSSVYDIRYVLESTTLHGFMVRVSESHLGGQRSKCGCSENADKDPVKDFVHLQ